jgi:hypothetical protein
MEYTFVKKCALTSPVFPEVGVSCGVDWAKRDSLAVTRTPTDLSHRNSQEFSMP